jgi:hypothetical protein
VSDRSFCLVINRSDSKCGACGRGADPHERSHDTILEWGDKGAGCGVLWRHLDSDYRGAGIPEAAMAMRPDLTWIGGNTTLTAAQS